MMAPTSVVPPPQLATSTSPPLSPQTTSPASTRSRIRAFNYLRGHHHSNTPTPVPPPPPPPAAAAQGTSAMTTTSTSTIRQVSTNSGSTEDQHNSGSATSWLPSVSSIPGLSRRPSAPVVAAEPVIAHDTTSPLSQIRTAPPATATSPITTTVTAQANSNGGISLGLNGASEHTSASPTNGMASLQGQGTNPGTLISGLLDGKAPSIRFVPHVDPRSHRRPHIFAPMERSIKVVGEVVKVGRFSDRDNGNPVGFKSKVVSRRHCEFWWSDGSWFVKDVGSSSGTFLNHVRLSHPNTESKPYVVHDGDVVQLGIDFKGGEELIFRCVKMKLELNRDAKSINQFNVAAHRRIQNLGKPSVNKGTGSESHAGECAICLLNIAPCQPLFVAPCSHVWHYKCIRPIIETTYPILSCPNCREIADLEADIEEATDENWEDLDKAKDDSANESPGKADDAAQLAAGDQHVEDRAKTPQLEEPVATATETAPMHIPLAVNTLATNGGDAATDPANQTPRNNTGPFVLNGTTGRI
ncbi:uncharacterized protein DFL_004764 [Arthrobotrys flagrans]|uniref:FHA domain-containing protein n=1 Tax=Arthrobotrys flagrans TaxID=97331 RepID=A0A437A644_ARTFL|nr:hypothetical protein DFL_004764 [Arthrobotrys flagrans]